MITFNNVKKKYGNKTILKNLNLEIEAGEFVVLIGPSGCGKTTTLKTINKLIKIDGGDIFVEGQNIKEVNSVDLRRKIGYVIQQIGLFPNMTIEQNIAVVPKLLKWNSEQILEKTKELMQLVEMPYEDFAHKYPSELSGGQQQRIGVLRALVASPPIILMDEPFGALDPITRDVLQDEVKKIQQLLNKTVVFVTHDMDEAIRLADKIVFMDQGEIVQVASPEEMLKNPASDVVRGFMGRRAGEYTTELKVEDFMKKNVVKVKESMKTLQCMEIMDKRDVDTLIAIDHNDKYLGVVTIDDIRKSGKSGHDIKEIIDVEYVSIDVSTDAKYAFDLMIAKDIKMIPVVSEHGKVVGLITKSSMAKAMAEALWGDL